MTTTTTTQVTYFEVIWGDDEADRIVYADEHDGTFISETAEHRATRKFLELIKNGVRCGFWVNGDLTCGVNATDGPDRRPTFPDDPAPPAEHKTRTVLDAHQNERYVTKSNGSCGRWKTSDTSVALCSCGWSYHAGTQAEARAAARVHRTATTEAA